MPIARRVAACLSMLLGVIGTTACVSQHLQQALLPSDSCEIELIVLGTGQDAGAPQIGNHDDLAWQQPALRQTASAIALVAHATQSRYLFDATPHITQQLQLLARLAPSDRPNLGLSGIFLTHAHIGHYAGLMYLGHEAAGTAGVPVYAMPRMQRYLADNGPWAQLVDFQNIDLQPLQDRTAVSVNEHIRVMPYRVPHRDEYSETVGFVIMVGEARALYLPDIDSWSQWHTEFGVRLRDMIEAVDVAFIDATFYADGELPGRDMSKIPHPRVVDTMALLSDLPATARSRVHFIHFNHTNPIRFVDSDATKTVLDLGFNVARSGDRHCLRPRQP